MFLFEVADKAIPVWTMYVFVSGPGLIGGLLGFLRWWVGILWFVGPTLFFLIVISLIQMDEIRSLYEPFVSELGNSYIIHSYAAPILSILINWTGISLGMFRQYNKNASKGNFYANSKSIGRI